MAAQKHQIPEDSVVDPTNLLEAAGSFKERGNESLKAKKYSEAVLLYEKGISTLDKADGHPMLKVDAEKVVQMRVALYANITQSLLKQELFRRALEAANQCLALDPENVKALYRRAVCRDALKQYDEALADVKTLESLASKAGPSEDELAALRAGIEKRRATLHKQLEEEAPDPDDVVDAELVKMKQRFDEIVQKYDLKDEETASEIADWLTRGNNGRETVITLKDLERRWQMEEDDA
eukprot:CAMPEP_0178438808 /NCGR_PEP_ID=MMETSP0689_2-20121128/35797_1 /TAXON_ID=160604 /ORGANISM="Amphidinium massartii, Strain CS-259" /LENGTH=237 /DNA_ID=CAMNT_0020061249 /DNA_START=58 /DNA_END=767 /DNA_ORIENTATION=+